MSAFPSAGIRRASLRRRIARGFVFFVLLLAAAAGLLIFGSTLWLRHAMRVSLPPLDGTLRAPGLQAPVTVRRDRHGVPHITASNLDDLLFAQGYVTAQDRLWQMDLLRRYAAGTLSEIMGERALEHDRLQRTLEIPEAAQIAWDAMTPDEHRYLADYARGVNAWIAQAGDHLPAEFRLLRYRPQPWQPMDSVLTGMNLAQSLSTDFPHKLSREVIEQRLHSPAMLQDLYPVGSWRDHPPVSNQPDITAPQPIPQIPLDPSQTGVASAKDILALEEQLGMRRAECPSCAAGSNNWVVSAAHSTTGTPLLSNDMHLDHSIPDPWYEAQLTGGGLDVAGVTMPGVPFVVVGHNQRIAWGFTLMYADIQDVYVEQTRGNQYRTAAGWQPIVRRREVIHVRGRGDVPIEVARTDHGPIITPLLPHEHRTLALRWTVYVPGGFTLPFCQLDSAQNWQQFRAALALLGGPPQNAVYADVDGNIGYQAAGEIPFRPNGLAATPITGDAHEWQGWIPFDALPSSYNPPGGILATANARITPDGYPYPITLDWADPYRNERIWKVLESRPKFSPADMLALQNDIYSAVDLEIAQRLTYAIDHAKHPDRRLRQAADILRAWNGQVTVPTAAATIVDAARDALWPMVLEPQLGNDWKLYHWYESAYVQEQIVTNQSPRWLPKKYPNWNEFLTAAVQRGLEAEHAPEDLNSWHYGYVHPVEVEHPIYGLFPWLRSWTGTGVQPQSGDGTTVKQVMRSFGPSERLTVDFSNLDRTTLNIVIGQSGDPLSPHYMDQWPYWYNGTTFRLPFSAGAVQAAAAHTLTLAP
jgi:penicillin amidase